ncbi:MAG: CAP domain-containing protein [Spirochaetales bacterium]|nr:CAP domain-containing protein [Spirochaetales bacterium]
MNNRLIFFLLSIMFFLVAGSAAAPVLTADEGPWDLSAIDTARNVPYLSKIEKDVILEVNKLRTNPAAYADQYLVPRRDNYSGRLYREAGKTDLRTNEGVAALNECIRALKAAKPLPPLLPSKALSAASADHVKDTGPKGRTGHTGTDGSSMRKRIERHGRWDVLIGENISYGYGDARNIVIQLVVDDGVSSRGHRRNLLGTKFRFIGTSVGNHRQFGSMCVMDFAGDISE